MKLPNSLELLIFRFTDHAKPQNRISGAMILMILVLIAWFFFPTIRWIVVLAIVVPLEIVVILRLSKRISYGRFVRKQEKQETEEVLYIVNNALCKDDDDE